ncbi:MAG: hypothetical protein ACI9FJ_000556 [Alteromonadaceae bacterium]
MTDSSRDPMITRIIVVLLIVVITILAFVVEITFKDIQTNTGFDSQARKNPFLAAQQFIEQSPVDASQEGPLAESGHGFSLLDNLPSTDDVIIITSARHTLNQRRTDALKQWVSQGGNLIIKASKLYDFDNQRSGDLLLDGLDIELIEVEADDDNEQTQEQEQEEQSEQEFTLDKEPQPQTLEQILLEGTEAATRACATNPQLTYLTIGGDPPIAINIGGKHILQYSEDPEPSGWASNELGVKIVQLNLGDGVITMLTDLSLWNNYQLNCFDNAYLLHILTQNTPKVWLLFSEEMADIDTLLWQTSPALVLSFLLLLSVWLWSQTLRFGALESNPSGTRRDFMEHIEAATSYRWRSGAAQQSIDLLRQQIIHKVTLRHSDFAKLDSSQQSELIVRLCDLPSSQQSPVQQALFEPLPDKTQQLISTVSLLQKLRKQLC